MSSSAGRVVAAMPNRGVLPDGVTYSPVRVIRHELDLLILPAARPTGAVLALGGSGGEILRASLSIEGREVAVPCIRRVSPGLSVLAPAGSMSNAGRFDRQERVFGREGQQVLSALHVGVVGAGGTGSAVVEQLVRLGVGMLTVIDDDRVSETNLTRIHQSTNDDIGELKCEVALRLAEELGADCRAVAGRITERSVVNHLTTCDVVFGCTDDNAGRIVLARMAPRYLQLLIDIGVTVDVVGGQVVGAPCRLSVQEPGQPCLTCRGHVDLALASAELLSPEDRQLRAGEGYVPGLGEPDPSVVAYTTLAASAGVAELLSLMFGLGGPRSAETLVDPVAARWRSLSMAASVTDSCTSPATIGAGDEEPFLGMTW